MGDDFPKPGFGKVYVFTMLLLAFTAFVAACLAAKW